MGFVDVYEYCQIELVKIDKENDKLYYNFRGKLLITININNNNIYSSRLSNSQLMCYIEDFKKFPNLYDGYKGTPSVVRDNKLKGLIG